MSRAAAGLLIVVLFSGCSGPSDRGLAQGVAEVKAILEGAGKNYGQSVALQSTLETGGTIINYIALNLPPGDSPLRNLKLEPGRPTQPWSIVIKEEGPRDYVIEGYGESLSAPVHTERVRIEPVPEP